MLEAIKASNMIPFCKYLARVTRKNTNYLVTRSDVEVHGICPDCQYKLGLNGNKEELN